jgi:hypothetical protein
LLAAADEAQRMARPKNDAPGDIAVNNIDKIGLLLEEYKLHKQEALHHLDLLYKQSSFIQLFGLVLLSLAVLVYGNTQTFHLASLPTPLRISSLIGAAILLFYLTSTVATASYSLLIGRRRMAQLETQINKLAGDELLSYETDLSARFHENFALIDGTLTPFAWASSWRMALFCGASLCLIFLSFRVMSDGYAIVYAATVGYFSFHQVRNYLFFFSKYGNAAITDTLDATSIPRPQALAHVRFHLTNWAILVIFCVIFFGDIGQFTDPISHSVARIVSGLGDYAGWQIAVAILAYSFLCAIGLPAPSEATLLLIPHVGLTTVYAVSAVGKGLGSVVLAIFVYNSLKQSGRFRANRARVQDSWVGRRLNGPSKELIYFLCQAIPWGPAKSSTILYGSYAGASKKVLATIFGLSGIGMVIRMYLVWLAMRTL